MSKAPSKHYRRPSSTRPRYQRGASAVLVAVVLLALLTALGTALDVGRLYLAQRDLQRLANLAALDGARAIGGCRGVVDEPQVAAEAAVRNSLQLNGADLALLDHPLSSVDLGVITGAGGRRGFSASAPEEAVAVQVTLVNPAPARLLPLFSTGRGNQRAQAAAFSAPMAALSAGSSLANLDAGDSPVLNAVLGGLLGGSLSLDAASYRGLANAQVTLQQLVETGIVAADIGDFLDTEIPAPVFLDALGEALSASDPALAALVEQIAAVADPARTVLPGDLFAVEQGLESLAGGLPVNAADLLSAIALAAAQGAPVDLAVPINLPGLASSNLQLRVIEPPQFGGPARPGIGADGQPRVQARTAQAEIGLELALNLLLLNVTLQLDMTLAQAVATLNELSCASVVQPEHAATVDVDTGIAALSLGLQVGSLLGPLANVSAGPVQAGSSATLEFDGPFVPQIEQPSDDNTKRVGTDPEMALGNALDDLTDSLLDELPALAALAPVVSLLTTTLTPALAVVLVPLLDILGLSLGTADVTIESVQISAPDARFGGNRPAVELVTH